MNGCELCRVESERNDGINLHRRCLICGREIHTTTSYHKGAEGWTHMDCEVKDERAKLERGEHSRRDVRSMRWT